MKKFLSSEQQKKSFITMQIRSVRARKLNIKRFSMFTQLFFVLHAESRTCSHVEVRHWNPHHSLFLLIALTCADHIFSDGFQPLCRRVPFQRLQKLHSFVAWIINFQPCYSQQGSTAHPFHIFLILMLLDAYCGLWN